MDSALGGTFGWGGWMVVSLFGAVRYGIIFLNGESCLGHRLGIMPETSEKAWLCGEGDHGQMERELSQSFRFSQKKFFEKIKFYARNSR